MVRSILDTNSSYLVTLSRAKSLPNTAEIPRYARNDVQREFCDMVKMSLPITVLSIYALEVTIRIAVETT